ncbi:hypothetical protein HOY34_02565 [Xinfangfangia sp. D13-10-4-6]|uniref:hypothetical protein n=1 Tax=Pseudogemmobacter hezensis TaxID=2737662 RepID=UPI001557A242|nr:hypothetical protein [Pseudogemmobacter hezensis]NPD14080.1 hypothetical protein [Pseudogemmobacter hezensis]
MNRFLMIAALGLVTTAHAARADSVGDDLYAMGRDYCAQSFVRDIGSFDAQEMLRELVSMRYPQRQFCDCVGTGFRNTADDEMAAELRQEIKEDGEYAMMASLLLSEMSACMPANPDGPDADHGIGPGIDLGLSDDDLNFDIADDSDENLTIEEVLADNMLTPDEGDIHACRLALDGDMLLPGFDPDAAKARIRATRQKLDEVCTCAGTYIASLGEPFQQEVEQAMNPATIYGSSLAAGINFCIDD